MLGKVRKMGGLFLSWRLIKLGELEISVHPFFLLFVFLWILAGLPLQTFLLFVVVLGHELTHALAAKLCGVKIYKVELFPFGGVGYLTNPLEFDPKKEFIVAGAGPVFNLALFLFLWNYRLGLYGTPLYAANPLTMFLCKANLFLFFFNLLPALPLDGGRLLRASLSPRLGLHKATELAACWGKWQGALLVLAGLLFSYYDYLHLSISLMGFFIFLLQKLFCHPGREVIPGQRIAWIRLVISIKPGINIFAGKGRFPKRKIKPVAPGLQPASQGHSFFKNSGQTPVPAGKNSL